MATLAFSVAGQFAGGLIGGPIGATIGRALGALAGSAIDSALFAGDAAAQVPADFQLLGSSEGGAIPRIYGWNRVAGNIIWATEIERQSLETSGSKGISSDENEQFVANFAIGLCQGEVAYLGRIWADGRLLETEGLNFRFYSGSATQAPDSLIAAKQGAANAPAYRGLCYLVFDGLPLAQFGNRIPNISVELCRVVGDLEPAIKAITIIPGATEFGYDPVPRVRIVGYGATQSENAHLLGQTSDWTLSLNELQALCPNLEHVALALAWFGDDLRCSQCLIQPRVENATRQIEGANWLVSGNTRTQVPVMSQYQGGPAYGGTPSDAAVLSAIADLKARGLKVTLYPFVMMDIEQSNTLTDPYDANTGQPAYPWRGRITCDPAPGQAGSPDQTSALKTQTDAFIGAASVADFTAGNLSVNYTGPLDWGYRRMILHYANLAVMAGGVNAMLIGSELRGLTWLRDSQTSFPFVADLVKLAGDVRSVVGVSTKIVYAADWSEYSGLQPPDAPGDKLFHLDPLWADTNIDAIGIDNYMPLSDWRGTGNEPDAGIGDYSQQLSYLGVNIAGGEGYDWYYASEADRTAATRTPITDSAYNEPWVWRYKDLTNWWANQHFNRVNGVRDTSATSWVPEAKPIWFSELGCGAVDKGPNSPNLFGDPKSSESARPHFSDGTPDALVQRQFLRAHHQWWQPSGALFSEINNPSSTKYSGRMLDPDRLFVWTWDARPYPAFPSQTSVWADGVNYETGHWLTGRMGALAADELLAGMASDYGVVFAALSAAKPLLPGARINNVVSLRRAIEPMLEATGLIVRDGIEGLSLIHPAQTVQLDVASNLLAAATGPLTRRQSPNRDEAIGQLALSFADRNRDYQSTTVTALAFLNPVQTGVATNLTLDPVKAHHAARTILGQRQPSDTLEFGLPLSWQALEVGDQLDVEGQRDGPFRIIQTRTSEILQVLTQAKHQHTAYSFGSDIRSSRASVPRIASLPEMIALHLPDEGGDVQGSRLLLGAFADPWPGEVTVKNDATGAVISRISARATLGVLTNSLQPGSSGLWDRDNEIEIILYGGHLAAATDIEVLGGANRMAVIKDNGDWEIIGFAAAELISSSAYRLTNLLRGTGQTQRAAQQAASSGNLAILLGNSVEVVPIETSQLETTISLRAFAGSADLSGQGFSQGLGLDAARPLAPANLFARKSMASNDIELEWKRRTKTGGDSWAGASVPLDFSPEAYKVSILNGASVVREVSTSVSSLTYLASEQVLDFGTSLPDFTFRVQQVSTALGPGHPATGVFNG